MKNTFLVVAFLLCYNAVYTQKINVFQWMIGNWKIQTPQGTIVEIWQVKNDSTLQGKSLFVKSTGDSILQETIEMAFRNGDWFYIPTVVNQNAGKPISFKVIFLRVNEFISENPEHDFPQRIAYRRIKQSLYATIEGKRSGKFGKQNFDYILE